MTWLTALAMVAQLQAGGTLPPDSVEQLRRDARRAEVRFERLSRRLIPIRWGSSGTQCDEIVGRFCLTYDSGRPPDPVPESGPVTDARREAIEALRRAYTYLADDFDTAAPLIRYLVEDDRASEAASTARLYHLASGDSVWGPLLLGFAEHAAGRDTAAERWFDEALARLPAEERRRIEDLQWILEPGEKGDYRRLDGTDRAQFERRFWTLTDPLYLTPGNESRNEHIARHVWSRMLERAPWVTDMVRWGDDLEQLTVRYGVPVARTRHPSTGTQQGGLTEYFDPDQLAYTPVDLLERGPPPTPLPGRPWPLERDRSRAGYAPSAIRRLVALTHQVTRFPADEGTVLRVDGKLVLDSAAAAGGASRATAAIFVLDSLLEPLGHQSRTVRIAADTARVSFEIALPQSPFVYSLETVEIDTRLAGRARYAVDVDSTAPGGPRVSDPLISFPWGSARPPASRSDPALIPRADLVLTSRDTLGLYAEALGLRPDGDFDVRLSIEPASRGSLPSRVVSWIGDKLGLSEPDSPTRLLWTDRADSNGRAVLAVELFPRDNRSGDHVIVLHITDATTGLSTESRRIVHIDDSR